MINAALVALCSLALQADDPNTKYLPDKGFSIQKPKKDEWQFRDRGNLARSQVIILNIVSDASIEMYSEELNDIKVNYDPKYSLEQQWKSISSNGDYKDTRQNGKIQQTTLPGGALNKQKVWLLDMTTTFPNGNAVDWKMYCFIGHENRSGYMVSIVTKQGSYEKHKADIEGMLSSIKTYRLPKK